MSYPILYSATETNFGHNGIGILSACVYCGVTEEANGIFELAMQYPMDGIHFEEISNRSIIKAKSDQFRDPQLFRVYSISKPMSGIVTVFAEHISYDLSGIPVKPFSASTVSSALSRMKINAVVNCPFTFWTDKTTQANFNVTTPASIRSRLGGASGSILDVYGGEYEFDNFTVKLHNSRGINRGVSIRYGKNLTDVKQDQNCSNVATGVYPYWVSQEDGTMVELPERIVNAPGTYNFVKIRTVDFSLEFETKPTIAQLRSRTTKYISENNIGVPSVSWSVSFEQLSKSEEYKHLALLERVSLFDTVNVEFPALGVSATAKAVKLVYDVIADRVKSVTLGSVRANIADTIANQQQEIIDYSKDKPSVSLVQKISSALAKAIMGANGGAVRLIDTNNDGEPDELYIADNPDPSKALKVWRFNYNGWAASKNGYSGPFEFGATLEDGLLANFVTAAQLVAGTIKSQDDGKTFFLDLDNGVLNIDATEFTVSGKTVEDISGEKADSAINNQTQEQIFNKLTNNGSSKGIYLLSDGNLYINASYLATGVLTSKDKETFYLDLDNGVLNMKANSLSISGKTVDDIAVEKANAVKKELDDFSESVTSDIEAIQSQIDGNITSWFYDYIPSTENEPAINWTTDELKNEHLGDLFYVVNNDQAGGRVYRWTLINDVYGWQIIEDSDVSKALAAAAKAQDTADGKRRVFVVQPYPPYDVGDLWAQGIGGDLKVCQTTRLSGSFSDPDWVLATEYVGAETVKDLAQNIVNSQTQDDVFNKLTNNGKSKGIFMENGDLFINASYIKSGKIVSSGMAKLPPTHDDAVYMLYSVFFPSQYPQKDFFDVNGDGEITDADAVLAEEVASGKKDVSVLKSIVESEVTITINPFDFSEPIVISGTNMWGSEIKVSLGINGSNTPNINGNLSVEKSLYVGDALSVNYLQAGTFDTPPKEVYWEDNFDGTFTLKGRRRE